MVSFDGATRGTPSTEWEASPRLAALPRLRFPPVDRVLVVAAHADDETLGAGGLIASCRARGIPVDVLVVTDGAASHPGVAGTAATRRSEIEQALAELGPGIGLRHLGVPDSATPEHRDRILRAVLGAAAGAPGRVLLVSTWAGDGHRDHRVVGEVAAEAAQALGHPALAFPVWLWHWADPTGDEVPWSSLRIAPLEPAAAVRKQRALGRYESQIAPRAEAPGEPAVLHPLFLRNFDRDEAFVVVAAGDGTAEAAGTDAAYFDGLYERHEDPWGYTSRWYEERKRALTLAALPDPRYGAVLEIGCSIGVLAEALAARSDALLAVDVSEPAVQRAQRRLAHLAHARVERCDVTEGLPDGRFDLVVLSEVGYYLGVDALDALLAAILDRLTPGGTLVSVHWRHRIDGLALDGDAVQEAVGRLGLPRLVRHAEEDLALDVHAIDGRSVARRAGLL